jgi:carbon starvation protein CstA
VKLLRLVADMVRGLIPTDLLEVQAVVVVIIITAVVAVVLVHLVKEITAEAVQIQMALEVVLAEAAEQALVEVMVKDHLTHLAVTVAQEQPHQSQAHP